MNASTLYRSSSASDTSRRTTLHDNWAQSLIPLPCSSSWGIDHAAEVGRFSDLGFPSRRDEAWKYTDLLRITGANWLPAKAQDAGLPGGRSGTNGISNPLEQAEAERATFKIVIADGKIVSDSSDLLELAKWCEVVTFSADSPPEWAVDAFTRASTSADIENGLSALRRASMGEVIALRVADDAQVPKPIEIAYYLSAGLVSTAVLLCVGTGASATLIENVSPPTPSSSDAGEGTFALTALGIDQKAGSRVEHALIASVAPQARLIASKSFVLAEDSKLSSTALHTGSGLVRQHSQVRIVGSQSQADFDILCDLQDSAHSDYLIRISHEAPDCRSNQRARCVLRDKAVGAFQGKIAVAQAAQLTDAYQQCDTRILSDFAAMNVKPELEIFADDVKCSHGSTTGQIDPQQLHYLAARGIPREQAERMLIEAFLGELIDNNPNSVISQQLRQGLGYDQLHVADG